MNEQHVAALAEIFTLMGCTVQPEGTRLLVTYPNGVTLEMLPGVLGVWGSPQKHELAYEHQEKYPERETPGMFATE